MINFLKKNFLSFAIIFTIITLFIMIFSHSKQNYDYILSDYFNKISTPIINAAKFSSNLTTNISEYFVGITSLKAENLILLEEIKNIKSANFYLIRDLEDYKKLKMALNFSKEQQSQKIYAQIITEVYNDYSHFFIVNRGTKDGVAKNQGVINYDGVVGKIVRVDDHQAIVQLITDVQSKIPALIEKSKTRSLVQGNGQNSVLLQAIPREEPINVGDKIVTSEITSVFPGSYYIGTVKEVYKKGFDWFYEAKINPAVQFDKIVDLFILPYPLRDNALKLLELDDEFKITN